MYTFSFWNGRGLHPLQFYKVLLLLDHSPIVKILKTKIAFSLVLFEINSQLAFSVLVFASNVNFFNFGPATELFLLIAYYTHGFMIQNLTKQNLYPPTSEVSREVENLIKKKSAYPCIIQSAFNYQKSSISNSIV